jgi:hypothetical protein
MLAAFMGAASVPMITGAEVPLAAAGRPASAHPSLTAIEHFRLVSNSPSIKQK